MTSDAELLRRYAEEESEDAFAELVRRHLDLVYFAALRQVGDPHLAEEIAQAVFTDLARKAATLWRRPVLASWLHTSTRFAAAKAHRTEQRRRRHEQEAETMNILFRDEAAVAEWERLRPLIDEAIHDLKDRDREAVLLRFFESQPFASIGVALDLSEDAARMRVERALEKLQALLARRGVTSTGAALAVALANQGALAAPAGLAASVTGVAFAASAGGGATTALLAFMNANKISLCVLAAISGVGAFNLVQQWANTHLRDELATQTQENRSLEPLRTENRRLSLAAAALAVPNRDVDELAQLRTSASELKKQLVAREVLLQVGGRVITRDTAPEQALEIMYPGGFSSPMRAWQTMLTTASRAGKESLFGGHSPAQGRTAKSAALHAKMVEMHALTFCVDEPGRAKLAAFLAALPDNARSEFGTPERLVAPVFSQWLWKGDEPRGFSFNRDVPAEGNPMRAYANVRITYASGQEREERLPFQRFEAGWRYGPLTGFDVDQLLALLDPATGQPKPGSK